MPVNLEWVDVVGQTTVEDGGYVGDLMATARSHIAEALRKNEITQAQAGEVYTAMIPAAFQSGIEYALKEQLTEAQIDDTKAATKLKEGQLALEHDKAEAELEKHWGYTVTRDIDDSLILGESTGTGKIDKEKILLDEEKETADKQQVLLDTQAQSEQYRVDNLLPAELSQIEVQTDVAERQMAEAEATGIKQRILLDTQEEAEQYKVDNLLPEQLIKLQEEVDLLQSQDLEILAATKLKEDQLALQRDTTEAELEQHWGYNVTRDVDGSLILGDLNNTGKIDKEKTVLDEQAETANKQQILLDTEEEAKQYEVDSILPEQLAKLTEEIDKVVTEKLAVRSKVEDENGKIIDDNGNVTDSVNSGTKHHWEVLALQDQRDVTAASIVGSHYDSQMKRANVLALDAKLQAEYGTQLAYEAQSIGGVAADRVAGASVVDPTTRTTVVKGYKIDSTGKAVWDTAAGAVDINNLTSLALHKQGTEGNIAEKTEKGYVADSYYKTYRSLQELMFALANSGIIDTETNSTYGRILGGMEKAMNGQLDIWGKSLGVDLNGDGLSVEVANTVNISTIDGDAQAILVTTATTHGLVTGNSVLINGTLNYDGTYTVNSVISSTQFNILSTAHDLAPEFAIGTVSTIV